MMAQPIPEHPCKETWTVDGKPVRCCLADDHWGAHWDDVQGVTWQVDTEGPCRVYSAMERRNRAARRALKRRGKKGRPA